jgi:hypothetical protein
LKQAQVLDIAAIYDDWLPGIDQIYVVIFVEWLGDSYPVDSFAQILKLRHGIVGMNSHTIQSLITGLPGKEKTIVITTAHLRGQCLFLDALWFTVNCALFTGSLLACSQDGRVQGYGIGEKSFWMGGLAGITKRNREKINKVPLPPAEKKVTLARKN